MKDVILSTACLLLAGLAATAQFPKTEALSPQGAAVVSQWKAAIKTLRDEQDASGPARDTREALKRRANLDQLAREKAELAEAVALPKSEAEVVETQIWLAVQALDDDNTRFLEANLPSDGWFRVNRDGRDTAHHAWIILQHSPDREFQRRVLTKMEPLVVKGEVDPADYARLYDRVEAFAGRPQRYGTQANCVGGVKTILPLENPSEVEARRRAIGLTETFADYKARLGVGGQC